MNAVTIAAQVFTIPISIYHFHQFPNYFILANLVAVPLSSLILLAEILLFSIGSIPLIASLVGKLVSWLIIAMNFIVETIESLPGSVWQGLYINLVQAIVLMLFFALAGYWLLEKSRLAFRISLIMLLAFSSLRLASFIKTSMQRKLIVYNINQKSAMDVVSGRCYSYIGDTSVQNDDFINRFHIRPLHIQFRLNFTGKMHELNIHENLIDFAGRHILMIDSTMLLQSVFRRPVIDILIISKNPKLSLYEYANSLEIKQVVFDASVPVWKARKWKTECDSLRIPCHDVTQDGAFVMSIR
jgi:competence protein ComEC